MQAAQHPIGGGPRCADLADPVVIPRTVGSGRPPHHDHRDALAAAAVSLAAVRSPPESLVTRTSIPCDVISARSPSTVYGPRDRIGCQPDGRTSAESTSLTSTKVPANAVKCGRVPRPVVRKIRLPRSRAASAASGNVSTHRQETASGWSDQPGRASRRSGVLVSAQAVTADLDIVAANG